MKKKAYISPETEVVMIKIEQLMGDVSVSSGDDGVHTPDDPIDNSDDPNRSRRRRNVWDEEEEEDW
jgi:hypothetical protein